MRSRGMQTSKLVTIPWIPNLTSRPVNMKLVYATREGTVHAFVQRLRPTCEPVISTESRSRGVGKGFAVSSEKTVSYLTKRILEKVRSILT